MILTQLPLTKPRRLNSAGVSHLLLPLVAVLVIAVAGTFAAVANRASDTATVDETALTAAANNSKPKSYMLVYGEDGRYTHANIKLLGTSEPHKCGKKLAENASVTKKIPKSRPLKLSCAPVGDGGKYEVTFMKSKTVSSKSPTVTVDIDSEYCTYVHRDTTKIRKVPVAANGSCDAPDVDTATQVATDLRVLPKMDANKKSFKGYVEISASEGLTKAQCTGQVSVAITGPRKVDYNIPVKYSKAKAGENKGEGYCVAKLKKYRLAAGDVATVSATFKGTKHLGASDGQATIGTKSGSSN